MNRNQNLLGKCLLVLRRHSEEITDLSFEEWNDLRDQIILITISLRRQFEPDHFNYSFLQNQDRHVHMHVIPRYEEHREFAGVLFTDPDYPNHYAIDRPAKQLSGNVFDQLADTTRNNIAKTLNI
ncbi:MAG: HIT domain-containing protein [Anaerolineales bacterium]|nr:HIT domain-containing protein [Anaerolineales bacterium]